MVSIKKGLLEISFPASTEGTITLHGWSSVSNKSYATLDSAKIIGGTYKFEYERTEDEITTPIFIDLYTKGSTQPKRLLTVNPYFDSYSNDIRLENTHITINVDSIPSVEKNKLTGKIQGSQETDLNYLLLNEMYGDHKFQFTDSTQYHVIDFNLIKKYDRSLGLLGKIYGDRTLYTLDSLKLAISLFDPSLHTSRLANQLSTYIKQQKIYTAEGISSNFVFYDANEKKHTFKDYVGNKEIGLIVFWASWCGPCVREIPELIKIHNEFGDKVAFVSLSVDEKKTEWIKAVNKYATNWLNLAGFPESKTKVVDVFGISYVPSFLIVDNKGRILLDSQNGREKTDNGYKEVKVEMKKLPDYLKQILSKHGQ